MSKISLVKCEAKLTAYRKVMQKDEVKISITLLINPADIHEAFAHMPLGEDLDVEITARDNGP